MTPQALHALGPNPAVTPDQFQEIWNIWPYGNPDDTYIQVAYDVRSTKRFDGQPLTFAFLVSQYKAYVKQCQSRNSDPKFTGKLLPWMLKRRYNENYDQPPNAFLDRWTS